MFHHLAEYVLVFIMLHNSQKVGGYLYLIGGFSLLTHIYFTLFVS